MYQKDNYAPLTVRRDEKIVLSSMLKQWLLKGFIEFADWFDDLSGAK